MVKCLCKCCHKEFEGTFKVKFMPIDLINDKKYSERIVLLKQLVKEANNPNIIPLNEFEDFKSGWDYIKANDKEGLVIRNDKDFFKVKILKEIKVEIKSHIAGSDKGTFVLVNGNKVSGTSKDLVVQFYELKSEGKIPFMELEYAFMTKDNHYFQPRCRQIGTWEDLNTS